MKVILADDVRGLGHRGETVTVKPGYARNYLFPQRLAYEATAANLRRLGEERKKYDEKMLHEKAGAENVAKQIDGLTVVITKKAGEGDVLYGSVTPAELAEPIKRLGEHRVHVRLHRDVTTELIVDVHPLAAVTA
jgi:large subunit ribosomal protein L9